MPTVDASAWAGGVGQVGAVIGMVLNPSKGETQRQAIEIREADPNLCVNTGDDR